MARGLFYKNALFCWRQQTGQDYSMPAMHRNAGLLPKHNFQSQHVSPQQCCVMKWMWMFYAESFALWGPATVPLRPEGIPYQLGHQTKSVARARLLSAHSKRRELAGVEKLSHFFSPFSRESSFQAIQGLVVLAAWLFYSLARESSPLRIFFIRPQQIAFLIAPWIESKAYFLTVGASWSAPGLFSF